MALQNNKSLGQHWLKDRAILEELADEAMFVADDPAAAPPLCLEIGPGLGTLTSSLLKRFPRVTAIEFDAKLAHHLPASFPGKQLEVIHANFLDFDLAAIAEPYVVAGNIPYYITTPIIKKLLEAPHRPLQIMLLIQKEVADRLTAPAGKKSLLTLEVENLATVLPGIFVSKDYFTPPPKVDSASIILRPRLRPLVDAATMRLVRQAFTNPRKKLIRNLASDRTLLLDLFHELQLSPNVRPAELELADYARLAAALASAQAV